jgi:putative FmdB family regulatory protein
MPIYEYRCSECGNIFEQMRPFSQAGESAICPKCGGKADKLLSVFASKENFYIKGPKGEAFRGPAAPSKDKAPEASSPASGSTVLPQPHSARKAKKPRKS